MPWHKNISNIWNKKTFSHYACFFEKHRKTPKIKGSFLENSEKGAESVKLKNIDLSSSYPKNVSGFLNMSFDYVITVCGGAKESCPAFLGNVKHRLHIGFYDPAEAEGSDKYILNIFRKIRDEINRDFLKFYKTLFL